MSVPDSPAQNTRGASARAKATFLNKVKNSFHNLLHKSTHSSSSEDDQDKIETAHKSDVNKKLNLSKSTSHPDLRQGEHPAIVASHASIADLKFGPVDQDPANNTFIDFGGEGANFDKYQLHSSPADQQTPPLKIDSKEASPITNDVEILSSSSDSYNIPIMSTVRARPIELPPFNGKKGDNIVDYLRTFARIKKANGWTDVFALDYLKCNLHGYAADWLLRYEADAANNNKSYDEFIEDLKSNLRVTSDSHLAERELYSRFQKKREKVRSFVCDMLRILERVDPDMSERRKVGLIRNNLLPHLVERVGTPGTIDELINRAEEHTVTKLVLKQRKKLASDSDDSVDTVIKKRKKKQKKSKRGKSSDSESTDSSSTEEKSTSSSTESDNARAKKKKSKKKKEKKKGTTKHEDDISKLVAALQVSHIPPSMVPGTSQIQPPPVYPQNQAHIQPSYTPNAQGALQQNYPGPPPDGAAPLAPYDPRCTFPPQNYTLDGYNRGNRGFRGNGRNNSRGYGRGRGLGRGQNAGLTCEFCHRQGHVKDTCFQFKLQSLDNKLEKQGNQSQAQYSPYNYAPPPPPPPHYYPQQHYAPHHYGHPAYAQPSAPGQHALPAPPGAQYVYPYGPTVTYPSVKITPMENAEGRN